MHGQVGVAAWMLRFLTESGSIYEIDHTERKVRRVSGKGPGTPRVGTDGSWRTFMDLNQPTVGNAVLIQWRLNPDSGALETTLTSAVQRVWEESALS